MMRKKTLVALGALVVSAVVMGTAMLWPSLDIFSGWDVAFLVAAISFFLAASQLLKAPADEWRELWDRIGPPVAKFFFAVSFIVFFGSIVMIFLPEHCGIFSSHLRNIAMLVSLFVMYCSSSYFASE